MNTLVPVQWSIKAVLPCNTQNEYMTYERAGVHACAQTHVHLCVTMHLKMLLHWCLGGLRYRNHERSKSYRT